MSVLSRSITISRAARDRDRSRQHRHPALRHAGRPLLPRLLRRLLLSAALRLLRPAPAAGEATARQCCRQRRCGRGSGTHRCADTPQVAQGAHRAARRLGLCQRGADGVVRGEPRRLRVRLGAQLPPGGSAGCRIGRGQVPASCVWRAGPGVPRFPLSNARQLEPEAAGALYEDLYCARGEAENRIGEQFELFADRASSATMPANQLRMWFSAMAYVLVDSLRRVGLRHTQFADAAVATIRLKLLKLGAQVRSSVRRLHFALASGCPNKVEFEMAYLYLRRTFNSS